MEPMDIVGKSKEDVSLPKATMCKIIKEMLPPDVRVARDAQDLLVECCVEFINLISSESNEVCSREEKRTIAPEHVLKALEVLGFGDYIEEVYAAYEQHKLETLDSPRGGYLQPALGLTSLYSTHAQPHMQRMSLPFFDCASKIGKTGGLEHKIRRKTSGNNGYKYGQL
ncbi:hypothetical protein AAC387_Pa05g3249 [Persea americana]